jgi:hypothetical protein
MLIPFTSKFWGSGKPGEDEGRKDDRDLGEEVGGRGHGKLDVARDSPQRP